MSDHPRRLLLFGFILCHEHGEAEKNASGDIRKDRHLYSAILRCKSDPPCERAENVAQMAGLVAARSLLDGTISDEVIRALDEALKLYHDRKIAAALRKYDETKGAGGSPAP